MNDKSEYRFYYDEEKELYVLAKFKDESTPIDTVFYYMDSLKRVLTSLNTLIYRGGMQEVNQVIIFDGQGEIDSLESDFFEIEKNNGQLTINVISRFNDSIYLEIGEMDDNFKNTGNVDSFRVINNSITIAEKDYYRKARIGVLKINSKNDYSGFEMYVSEKFID